MLAHELSHVGNRDILIGSVAAAIATGISFVANMAMWAPCSSAAATTTTGANPIALILLASSSPRSPPCSCRWPLSRSREFEADRTGARLIGDGEPLARALVKLEQGAKQIPMNVEPAQASMFIVNPLTGRKMHFTNLFTTHPPTEDRIARLRAGTGRTRIRRQDRRLPSELPVWMPPRLAIAALASVLVAVVVAWAGAGRGRPAGHRADH